ncbi:uncharacterized protein CXorf65 homolog [Ptychodera flava]|uniref:uncharacterized protein CXorf65 homolog n=1 Tax=Ptychodera flava TaxID=63121 RepID=UPI003969F09E
MFITVRYGDSEEALFNPNCRTMLLLENIKQRCRCDEDVEVDLSDNEGNIKYLHVAESLQKYANEILKERETFVLVKVERSEESNKAHYVPLLNDDTLDAAFLAKLARKDENAGTQSSKRKKRSDSKSTNQGNSRGRSGSRPTPSTPSKSTTPTGKPKRK